jgi:predicted PurR-regulated permease PerM
MNEQYYVLFKIWAVGFLVYGSLRYIIPSKILGKDINLKSLIVLSSFYGFALLLRRYLMGGTTDKLPGKNDKND